MLRRCAVALVVVVGGCDGLVAPVAGVRAARAAPASAAPVDAAFAFAARPRSRAAALALAVATQARYHIVLAARERGGAVSWKATQAEARRRWTRHVFATEGWLYAVQTLRNGISANTFLASTVLTLFTLSCGSFLGAAPARRSRVALAQIGAAGVCLLSSAYAFSQSARLMTHAGFMFPVAADCGGEACGVDDAALARDVVERVVVRSHKLQWVGWRALYLSAAVGAWVLGGEGAALAASLALAAFFAREDRCPTG